MTEIAEPVIKVDLARQLASDQPVVIELGCGTTRHPGRLGVDLVDNDGVDIVADLERHGLEFLPDRSVDVIYSNHVLEHIDDLGQLIAETARVLKPDGYHDAAVPHFSNPFYYSDPTHRRPFGLYTMAYYASNASEVYRRSVPGHYTGALVELHHQTLWFRSVYEARILRRGKRALNSIVNRSPGFQELYEEHLAWIIPCYEIRLRYGPVRH